MIDRISVDAGLRPVLSLMLELRADEVALRAEARNGALVIRMIRERRRIALLVDALYESIVLLTRTVTRRNVCPVVDYGVVLLAVIECCAARDDVEIRLAINAGRRLAYEDLRCTRARARDVIYDRILIDPGIYVVYVVLRDVRDVVIRYDMPDLMMADDVISVLMV